MSEMMRVGEARALAGSRVSREVFLRALPDDELLALFAFYRPAVVRLAVTRMATFADGPSLALRVDPRFRDAILRPAGLGAELVELERRCVERDRPAGCWCLGSAARWPNPRPYDSQAKPGSYVRADRDDFAYCPCPDGQRLRAQDQAASERFAVTEARAQVHRLLAQSEIPAIYRDCTLATYPRSTAEQRTTVKFFMTYLASPAKRWLYLWGESGRGKTALACTVGLDAIAQGKSVAFCPVRQLMSELSSLYPEPGEGAIQERIDALVDLDVLILDDMGAEKVSDWRTERLEQVIDRRKNGTGLTIVTSNLPLRVLSDPDHLGGRIGTRIEGMGTVFEVAGPFIGHGPRRTS